MVIGYVKVLSMSRKTQRRRLSRVCHTAIVDFPMGTIGNYGVCRVSRSTLFSTNFRLTRNYQQNRPVCMPISIDTCRSADGNFVRSNHVNGNEIKTPVDTPVTLVKGASDNRPVLRSFHTHFDDGFIKKKKKKTSTPSRIAVPSIEQ